MTETLNESYEKSQGIRDFLSLIRNYQGLKELDATIVNALIDKILVSEREKMADGTVRQEIKIYYKFIGFVGELHITPTKRWTALPAKHCTVCGVEYVPGSGISKYCPACAKRMQREKSNESKRRSREQKRMVCIELSAKNDRLNQAAVQAVRELRQERNFGPTAPLVSDEKGDYTRPVNFRKRYYRILKAAGIEQKGLHSLRHTFGSSLVNDIRQPDGTLMALSPRQVADLLGHSTSQITEMYYVKKDTTRLQGITDGFNF